VILQSLGDENTTKKYLFHNIGKSSELVALKLLKREFLARSVQSLKFINKKLKYSTISIMPLL